jgi:hypothetical protein
MEVKEKDGKVYLIFDKSELMSLLVEDDKPEVGEKVASQEVEYPSYESILAELDKDGVDLFEKREGVGGELQESPKGLDKIKEFKTWLDKNKFSEAEFLRYLLTLKDVAGWPLSKPVVGVTDNDKPTLFKLALRYFTYWKSQQDTIAKEYKAYVYKFAKEILEGEEA